MRRSLTAGLLLLIACVGDEPIPVVTPDPAGADAGGGVNNPPANPDGGGPSLAPLLKLEGQPLVLVAGTTDTIQFKVLERRDIGELAFKVLGAPEGITVPSTVTLGAAADALNIPVTSVASTKHGDFVLTVEADGQPYKATAGLVVRGTAGSPDTSFGLDGTELVPHPTTGTLVVAGLADDRILLGTTAGGKPALRILSPKGASAPMVTVTQTGTLRDLAPTADGGFVALVESAGQLRLVWYSKAGAEATPSLVVSTNVVATARIAATPLGTLFAQAKTNAGVFVGRYVAGAADPAFPGQTLISSESVAALRFLGGATDGSAWVGMRTQTFQEAIARVTPGQPLVLEDLSPNEGCNVGGPLGNDVVAYCTNDVPSYTLRRFTPTGDLAPTFGTFGRLPIQPTVPQALLGFGSERLYVAHSTGTSTRRISAYDGKGALRTVFATNGLLAVSSVDPVIPTVVLDARGRLLFVNPEQTTTNNIRVRRFWD